MDVANAFDMRLKTKRQERGATEEERIDQGYHLVQGIARLGVEDFHSVFIPTSLVRPIEPEVGEVLRATFGELIPPDFRTGLEEKGRVVFAWNGNLASDEGADGGRVKPTLSDSTRYRSLEQFAREYRTYVDNYFRYIALSTDASGDLNELGELGNYVTGHSSMSKLDVPEEPYGRALREATRAPGRLRAIRGPCGTPGTGFALAIRRIVVRRRQSGSRLREPVRRALERAHGNRRR